MGMTLWGGQFFLFVESAIAPSVTARKIGLLMKITQNGTITIKMNLSAI